MAVAEGLGPPAAATSSAVRSCISLQRQPALSTFLSSHWADDGGKAGPGAEGPAHQQCPETHLLSMQRELLPMTAEKCFLRLLLSSCCWQLVFFSLFTLWFKRELAWNQDKIENPAVVSRTQPRVGCIQPKEAPRASSER